MEKLLDLLGTTESLLVHVRNNIGKLEQIDTDKLVAEKIQPVAEAYAQANQVILDRKVQVLKVLAKLSLLAGKTDYYISLGACWTYHIISEERIAVIGGDSRYHNKPAYDMRKHYSLKEFISCNGLNFWYFCDDIIEEVKRFLVNSPGEQAAKTKLLHQLHSNLEEISKQKE